MTDLTAVSLFAGIGGIDLALQRAGVRVVAAVEVDPAARSVLARHFPDVKLFNDVTEVTGDELIAAGFVPRRGILAGGFPCQDLSVAGRRAGLGGARSGLFWEVMRLADELSPRWLLLENVPGLLSAVCQCPGDGACVANGRAVRCGGWRTVVGGSGVRERIVFVPNVPHTPKGGACEYGCMRQHGGAMGSVLGAVGERGFGVAYRILDAQHFGVPQRRRRVFIAGCLGDRAAPVQVLLEPEGGTGHPAAGGAARTGTARGAEGVAGGTGAVATLQGGGRRGHRVDAEGAAGGHLIASAPTARQGKGPDSDATSGFVAYPLAVRGREGGAQVEVGQPGEPAFTVRTPGGGSSHPMIAHALTSEGADASEDGTGWGTPLVTVAVAAPLTHGSAAGEGVNAPGRRREDDTNLVAYPLLEVNGRTGDADVRASAGTGIGDAHDPMFTLQAGKKHGVTTPMAISENQRGEVLETPYSRQITTGGGKPGQGYPAVRTGMAVRRLSPLECERLQGFPDNWTKWAADGTEQSDSARYRQCGNAVAVPVVEWIARRLVAVEGSRREAGAA